MVNHLHHAVVLDALPIWHGDAEPNDPNDAFLLAMAQVSQADFLVTGDRKAGLLQQGSTGRTRIVTPTAFCAHVHL